MVAPYLSRGERSREEKRKGGGLREERGSVVLPDVLPSPSFQFGSVASFEDWFPSIDPLSNCGYVALYAVE